MESEIDRVIDNDIEMVDKQFNEEEQLFEEKDEETQLLKDRFHLSSISIAESEAKKIGMQVSENIVACISNLAFNYAEHLAKDLELFARHAGRKLVNTEDVILAGSDVFFHCFLNKPSVRTTQMRGSLGAHRNENLSQSLRTFCNDLKAKEPQTEKRRKKTTRKEDKATTSAIQPIEL